MRAVVNWHSVKVWLLAGASFVALAGLFFWPIGLPPWQLFGLVWQGAFGDGYALSETLVKATPVLWCAIAVAIPAQLGLISIGAEGQMYVGAIAGAGWVFMTATVSPPMVLIGMLFWGALGGFVWGFVPGWMRAKLNINETLVSLLLNFVAVDILDYLIHGPWKAPEATNWPQSVTFPECTVLPSIVEGYRTHVGLIAAALLSVLLYFFFAKTRWGLITEVLRHNPRLARTCGVSLERYLIVLMAAGGLVAGLGGISEAAAIQTRLESHFLPGYGLSGYLVSWLAHHDFRWLFPLSVMMGAILSSADVLQLSAHLPSSAALILQGLLFGVLVAAGRFQKAQA